MSSLRKSVFLTDQTVNWITSTTAIKSHDQAPKWSEAINSTVAQFRFLIRESLPELTADEWQVILNVYSGCYFPAHGVPARIASDMMDNVGAISIEELSPDYAEMVKKVYAMSQVEQLAILYFVQMFWSNTWTGEWDEIVAAIKAKF